MPTPPLEFSKKEREVVKRLLAAKVVNMYGRKLEEADWTEIYCKARGLPNQNWSNLKLDVMVEGLGLEIKMLGVKPGPIASYCGTSLMHPSATRSISVPTGNAKSAMEQVLSEYADLLERRRLSVEAEFGKKTELRSGWLLWKRTLDEFLYFEENLVVPDYSDFSAEWYEHSSKGSRLKSRNLWIYDKDGRKRYSVTTERGVKVQPYFDVPPSTSKNLSIFRIQGEEIDENDVRLWLSHSTYEKFFKRLEIEKDSLALINEINNLGNYPQKDVLSFLESDLVELPIDKKVYRAILENFEGVSDEHRIRQFLDAFEANRS